MRQWGYPDASETLPYKVLDRKYFLWKSGWLKREPAWQYLCRHTRLARARKVHYFDDLSAYSVTHTIFYLTDFGHCALGVTDNEQSRIRDLVECLLVHYWRTGHWDLVGELLISLECLGNVNSIIYAGGTNAFQSAWLDNGAIPPVAGKREPGPSTASPTGPPDDPQSLFRLYYHTTLVGALYCSVALGRLRS